MTSFVSFFMLTLDGDVRYPHPHLLQVLFILCSPTWKAEEEEAPPPTNSLELGLESQWCADMQLDVALPDQGSGIKADIS